MLRPRTISLVLVALALLIVSFATGAVTDRAGILPGSTAREPAGVGSTFDVFWESWNLVQKNYVDRSAIDSTKMTYGAIDGMLSSLGDLGHTRFLSPQDLKAEQDALSGRLEGVGAEILMRDGMPTVVAPIPGTPAQKAGVLPGDIIVRVDGKSVAGLSLGEVVNQVRGPAGTSVTLTVVHHGETTPTDITVVRSKITVPSVSWAQVPGTTIAHVLVSQFAEHVSTELTDALKAARAKGATSIILDLRNDPGGLRDEAVAVASQFLGQGNVLLEQDAEGHRTSYPVKSGGVALDVPLVVLINEGTASSSEIVAGALQDYKRGELIGATTIGTGTVLSNYGLSDGSALLLGTSEWLTPDGRQIWHHGITPDIAVAMPAGVAPLTPDEEGTLSAQQLQDRNDAQLLRAAQELDKAASPIR